MNIYSKMTNAQLLALYNDLMYVTKGPIPFILVQEIDKRKLHKVKKMTEEQYQKAVNGIL